MSSHFEALQDFIANKMRMSHIYQPVMLMELLRQGGNASVTDISKALLVEDQSEIAYYEKITKEMVGRVLRNHKLVSKDGNLFKLNGFDTLSHTEIDELVALCTSKLNDYVEQRGSKIWAHRSKASGYVPGTLRYQVFKRARLRCELCGVSANEKGLEVDHIVPRSLGGTDDISNLQSLCYSCNSTKRNLDDEDLRGIADSYGDREEGCIFCELPKERIVAENELALAFRDLFPVTEGHTLVIPKRHVSDMFDLYQPELNAIHSLLNEQKKLVQKEDQSVTAFNVGVNAGKDAGQTVFHCHFHLIPRRSGDVSNPRGGVRGVIPSKQGY